MEVEIWVHPILVAFDLGWFSTSMIMGGRVIFMESTMSCSVGQLLLVLFGVAIGPWIHSWPRPMVAFQVHWSSTPQSWNKQVKGSFQKYGMATPIWVFPPNHQFKKKVFPGKSTIHFGVFSTLFFGNRAEDDVGYLLGQSLGKQCSHYCIPLAPVSRSWGLG